MLHPAAELFARGRRQFAPIVWQQSIEQRVSDIVQHIVHSDFAGDGL